jgi:hypothetical protein
MIGEGKRNLHKYRLCRRLEYSHWRPAGKPGSGKVALKPADDSTYYIVCTYTKLGYMVE